MATVHTFADRNTIEREAREWLIRLDGDDAPSQDDIEALHEWVDRSLTHRKELLRISTFWNDANILTELSIPLHSKAERKNSQNRPGIFSVFLPPSLAYKRVGAVMAVSILAIGVAILNGFYPSSNTRINGIYATAIGEMHLQILADSSVMEINTDSQVQVDYSDVVRKIRLLRGEAHFVVAHDPGWPFEVYAGRGRVKAVGTAFSVRLTDDRVKVTVFEGKVDLATLVDDAVAREDAMIALGEMSSGNKTEGVYKPVLNKIGSLIERQSVTFSSQPIGAPELVNGKSYRPIDEITTLAQQDLERQLSWRGGGYLVFAGDPLSHVVDEVNRYTPVTIDIADSELRDLRIGGRFKVGELDAMLDALKTFGIQVSRLDDQHIQLLPAQR